MSGVNFRNSQRTGLVTADGFVTATTAVTFDPPSLTTGAFAVSSGITVNGVELGDAIDLYPPYDTQGIMYQGSVSAADTIVIALTSCAAGTVDLASGTWGVAVKRRV